MHEFISQLVPIPYDWIAIFLMGSGVFFWSILVYLLLRWLNAQIKEKPEEFWEAHPRAALALFTIGLAAFVLGYAIYTFLL